MWSLMALKYLKIKLIVHNTKKSLIFFGEKLSRVLKNYRKSFRPKRSFVKSIPADAAVGQGLDVGCGADALGAHEDSVGGSSAGDGEA
jgi:hypothetical protein